MTNYVWEPVGGGSMIPLGDVEGNRAGDAIQVLPANEYIDGPKQLITVAEEFGEAQASVYLPGDLRLCRRTPAPDVPVAAIDEVAAMASAYIAIMEQTGEPMPDSHNTLATVRTWLDQQEANRAE